MYENKESGLGFFGGLTIAFIVLKIVGAIEWSWIWVISPLWFPFCLFFGVGIVLILIKDFIDLLKGNEKKPNGK